MDWMIHGSGNIVYRIFLRARRNVHDSPVHNVVVVVITVVAVMEVVKVVVVVVVTEVVVVADVAVVVVF